MSVRRLAVAVVAAVLLVVVVATVGAGGRREGLVGVWLEPAVHLPGSWGVGAYRGLGAWVDAFDYSPAHQNGGSAPIVTPADVRVMAFEGVQTLFLQAAKNDSHGTGGVLAPRLTGQFLVEAHRRGIRVVAWYVPKFDDVALDLQYVATLRDFSAGGQHFDGIALDIEWTGSVPDPAQRNRRLLELARGARHLVGRRAALGAIVLPPVLIEDINPDFWPAFPWRGLADTFDVWMPMSYWTLRRSGTRDADPALYTSQNVRRLRIDLGRPRALVHPIGGVGDKTDEAQVRAFVEAARRADAIGVSVYDYRSSSVGAWAALSRLAGSAP